VRCSTVLAETLIRERYEVPGKYGAFGAQPPDARCLGNDAISAGVEPHRAGRKAESDLTRAVWRSRIRPVSIKEEIHNQGMHQQSDCRLQQFSTASDVLDLLLRPLASRGL
jgi:hypothetical protein